MINYDNPDLFYEHETVNLIIVDSLATVTPVAGEAPLIENASLTLTEEDIDVESFSLNESLCSANNLEFGRCESSQIQFNLYANTQISSLEDVEIAVYMYFNDDSSTLLQVGLYLIEDDNLSVNNNTRKITGYDWLYYVRDYDITEWYNNIYENRDVLSIKQLRDGLFDWMHDDITEFEVVQETTTLTNDNYLVEKSIESDVVTFGFFMQHLLEINGVFGHINREGVFSYISLEYYDDDPVQTLDDELLIPPVQYKDWNTWGIGYVAVYDRNNNRLAKIGDSEYRHPSIYNVVNSFVFTNNTRRANWKQQFEAAVSNMREAVTHRRYRSCTVKCVGNLCLEVGDRIDVTWEVYDDDGEVTGTKTFKTYILERNFKGIQEFTDTYIAKGDRKQPKYETGKSNDNWHVGDNQINTLDGVENIATDISSEDFVEIIRNIGFRLLDEPSNVEVEYTGGGTYPEWHSGELYEYAFTGIPFYNGYYEGIFNEVAQKNSVYYGAPDGGTQWLSGIDEPFPDTLFILNGANLVSFRYGYTTGNNQYEVIPENTLYSGTVQVYDRDTNSKAASNINGGSAYYGGIITISGDPYTDIDDFIDYIFANRVPFGESSYLKGAYPYIKHVVLCDNLTTLENATEYHPGSVSDSEVKIKWTDPPDIITNEPVPATWAGTVVVRKEGSAPKHRWDGTLIINSTTRDEYSETPLVDDTIEAGKQYYYGIFPYDTQGDYRYTKVIQVNINTAGSDSATFGYTGEIQTYVVPKDAIYRIEAWGAQGGSATDGENLTANGGYGSYSTGEVLLHQGDTLYIVVGGQGGYNGGGTGS